MLSVTEALDRIFTLAQPVDVEEVPLGEAAGRVLAHDVAARITQPPFASSAMDGYAVRNDEAQTGMSLKVVGESAAGKRFDGTFGAGETIRIFTGAPVPDGADCIVIQEDTKREGDTITIKENRDKGPYLRPAGNDFREGDLFKAPKRLTSADVALLASMNIPRVPVRRRPVVSLVSNGNELVMPGEIPGPDQIIVSNTFGLKALLKQQGAEVRVMPIAKDTLESLSATLDMCAGSDLLVTIGGASVGDHDLVHKVAAERGMALDFYKVKIQPGKPLMAGMMDDTPMVGLPGNPVSAMVCGHVFLRPMIDVMLGLPAVPLLRETGILGVDLGANGWRENYLRAEVAATDAGWIVTPFDRQDSALLGILGRANALMVRPPDQGVLKSGELVRFIRIT